MAALRLAMPPMTKRLARHWSLVPLLDREVNALPDARSESAAPDWAEQRQTEPADAAEAWLRAYRRRVERDRAAALRWEWAWSWGRLISFAAALVVWYPLGESWLAAGAGVVGALLVFAFTVRRHRAARIQRTLADHLLTVIDEARQRCGGKVVLLRSGNRPVEPGDADARLEPILNAGKTWQLTAQERDDLDLYSPPVGLFGLLNRTSTILGARRLAECAENPSLEPSRIEARQACVRWLDEHPEARLELMAAATDLRGKDEYLQDLVRAVRGARALPWGGAIPVLRLWSLVTLALTVVAVVLVAKGSYDLGVPWVALVLINGAVFMRLRRALVQAVEPWRRLRQVAQGYLNVARQGVVSLPRTTELDVLRVACAKVIEPGRLGTLVGRVGWADSGGMFHGICNALFFYDLHVADAVLKCVVPYRDTLLAGLAALAEIEALTSLACFAKETRSGGQTCYPTPVSEPKLELKAGWHPLIAPHHAVPNDVHLSDAARMWLITGSNMAGKSTLLRMTGVNLLLAQMGTVACAEELGFKPQQLITDLCVRDDLAKEESYFLAEVRQLRRLLTAPAGKGNVLGLIDEPFRGTNSEEQAAASLALVQHLLRGRDFCLLATHERRLTSLANGAPAVNYHFREDLDSEGLTFDYHLHPGPAPTRNALRVLGVEAYPQALLDQAHEWLSEITGEDSA